MKRRRWFIYVLRCPLSWEVRYVGKAKDPKDRLDRHLRETPKHQHHAAAWIRKLLRLGLVPLMEVIDAGRGDGHGPAERAWIAEYRLRGADLTNTARGGVGGQDGMTHTPEALQRMLAANIGRKMSAETRAKMSAAAKGKKKSPETRARMSAAQKARPRDHVVSAWLGRKHTAESRAKMSAARRRRRSAEANPIKEVAPTTRRWKKTPEQIEKTASKNRGLKRTAEARARMSVAKKGKKPSAETRAKISATKRLAALRKKQAALTSAEGSS